MLAVCSFVMVAETISIGADSVVHSRIFKELLAPSGYGEPREFVDVAQVVAAVAAIAAFFLSRGQSCCRHCKV